MLLNPFMMISMKGVIVGGPNKVKKFTNLIGFFFFF